MNEEKILKSLWDFPRCLDCQNFSTPCDKYPCEDCLKKDDRPHFKEKEQEK